MELGVLLCVCVCVHAHVPLHLMTAVEVGKAQPRRKKDQADASLRKPLRPSPPPPGLSQAPQS